jgi:hypothetical protein
MLHQIKYSGPTELVLLAEYAAATGDRELGARSVLACEPISFKRPPIPSH